MQYGSTFRFFLLLCLFLTGSLQLAAQRPTAVNLPKNMARSTGWKMDCNDAGEVEQFTNFAGQSTTFGANVNSTTVIPYLSQPDTIFLCAQDQFDVNIRPGSTDLSGDPFPGTTAGVGFAFYRCDPTVSGPTLGDIVADPCVADNGLAPFDELAIGVPGGYLSGDYTLTVANDGTGNNTIPALFPVGGEPTPVVLTLAPITFDDVNANGRATYESVDQNSPAGSCVDVSTNQSFAVAFLNPVSVANLPALYPQCTGSFDVRGGTPELRGGTGYTINIINVTTGARGVVTTPASQIVHNAVIEYTVPAPGTYRIEIEDAFSCGFLGTVEHQMGCPLPVVFKLPVASALPGANVCFPVTAENFFDITAFQFDLGFDPAVLAFTGVADENPALPAAITINTPVSTGGTLPEGEGRIIYNDNFGGPATVADGDVLFSLCFTILGSIGDVSELIEISGFAEFTRDPMNVDDLVVCEGRIAVTDQAFLLTNDPVSETCRGDNNGQIVAEATGSPAPYTFSIRRLNPNPQVNFGSDRTENANPATTTFNGLEPGQYAIRAVDANGDEVIDTVTVMDGFDIAVNIDPFRQPSCNGEDDGIVVAEITEQGVAVTDPIAAGYTIQWVGGVSGTDTLRNLTTGQYGVTVTAPNGICMAVDQGNLSQPAAVQVLPNNPADAVSSATCSGSPDGSITVSAAGGSAPYTFNWGPTLGSDVATSNSFRDNLVPGAYAVTVTDANMCSAISNFTVDAQKTLIIVSEVDSITCFGDDDGVIRVNGSFSGAAPVGDYMVSLENLQTNATTPFVTIVDNTVPFEYTDLAPGRYVVTLMDETMLANGGGCATTDTFEIFQPALLAIGDSPTIRNETCTMGMDGNILATITGGTLPYEYNFVNDSLDTPLDTITPGPSLTDLSADTNYVLIVTDANGCVDSLPFRINAPASAILQPVDTSFISCPGDTDGQLSVDAAPPAGETISSIIWYRINPDGTRGATVASGATTLANLPVGDYLVEVITSNSCVARQLGTVVSPGEVFLESFALNNPICPGQASGNILLTPGGGTPNADGTYNYVWSTDPLGAPTTNPAFNNLMAGTYSVTITDGNGCLPPFDTTFVLVDPPAIIGTFNLTPVSCPDDLTNDGAATFTAGYSDGTQGTYDFFWLNDSNADFAATSSTVTDQRRGPISVRVTDGTCTVTFDTIIASPDEFEVSVDASMVSCSGDANGTATVNISGGTPDYVFTWSASADTDNMIDGLTAGTYTVDIVDDNGCSPGQQTFTISQPNALELSIDPVQTTPTVACAGDANGRIGVFVSSVNNNDLADNPYNWSNNAAGPDQSLARDLAPGTYSVTVTDVEGCQDSIQYTIGEPEAITFSVLPIEEPQCFGETTEVMVDTAFGGSSNGIEDFTFTVNNDGFRIPVGGTGTAFSGEVVVTVFDSVGCTAEQTFSVNQPPEIIIDLPERITVELGDTLTRLNPLISPVGDLYEYLWTPAEFLEADTIRSPIVRPFTDTDYQLRVTNANQCQAFANIFVEVDANRNVYIPNAFSPNRDGRNEEFRVFTCQGVKQINSFQVFDRWGGLLNASENILPPNCLDGTILWNGDGQNGKPVNPGVFVYFIEVEFLDDRKLVYRGDVTVIR